MVHFSSGFADRNAVFSNRKIFFVLFFDATFFIQVNKRPYLSVTEIAKKWNVSERSIRNYCARGV